MAIKERKQITGTTEQINAYEGHEGQIVWDKDKKTLVGMSGTVGKNYPLAQQAYVDEGLEGKEDKGVCLPLTGGSLTGDLFLNKRPVETISEFGRNYIRYSNGLQIVFDRSIIPSSRLKIYNYPVPFVDFVSVATAQNQNVQINVVNFTTPTQCELASSWTDNENNACWIIAIGRWK